MPPANSTFDRCCTLCPFPSISLPWVDVHGSRCSLCAIFIPLLFPRSSWRAAPGFSPGYSAAIAVFAGPVYGQGDASAETPWPGRRHPRDVEEKEEEGQPELQAPREAVLAHRVLFASLKFEDYNRLQVHVHPISKLPIGSASRMHWPWGAHAGRPRGEEWWGPARIVSTGENLPRGCCGADGSGYPKTVCLRDVNL